MHEIIARDLAYALGHLDVDSFITLITLSDYHNNYPSLFERNIHTSFEIGYSCEGDDDNYYCVYYREDYKTAIPLIKIKKGFDIVTVTNILASAILAYYKKYEQEHPYEMSM